MKGVIEFVGYFILKTGRKVFEMEFEDDRATVGELLLGAEKAMTDMGFRIIEDEKLKKGVLLFCRKENGGIERVFKLDTPLIETGGTIIMITLMGGG